MVSDIPAGEGKTANFFLQFSNRPGITLWPSAGKPVGEVRGKVNRSRLVSRTEQVLNRSESRCDPIGQVREFLGVAQ